MLFVEEAFRQGTEFFDAAVAKERPPAAHIFRAFHIDINDLDDFFVLLSAVKEFTLRACDKGASPKLDAVGLSAGVGFVARAVNGDNGKSVGHGVTALYRCPGLALAFLFLGRIATFVADGGGVDEEFSTAERHQARTFGVPLVPAHLNAKTADARIDGLEAEVARREVELFVIGGVVGDVHLAVFSSDATVSFKNHGRVVIKSRGAAFEEGSHENNLVAARQITVEIGGRSRDRLCEVEEIRIFRLTEIERIVEFLQHHQLCALFGGFGDAERELLFIVLHVGRARHLDNSDFHVEY